MVGSTRFTGNGARNGSDLMERYEFDSEGDRLVGNLHLPQGDAHGVAILTGPLTSVKEQATGAWASALAERGFGALSFDHRYYGESAGRPRQLENPAAKIADIQAAAASLHSDRRFASTPMFAVGICAGGGYMARAVATQPLFCAFAGVAGYYAQATEQSINSAAPAIARASEAEKRWRETGANASARGMATLFHRWRFFIPAPPLSVQSWAYTSTFDAIGAANLIRVPTIVIHSERALAPSLARRFQADLNNARILWVESSGQIDFYDNPHLIAIGADAVTKFFKTATR